MRTGASLLRANAFHIPLADESVDLVCTSPPYHGLRLYQDEGDALDGQIGAEDTPQGYLEALWATTAECWRVLRPSGSLWMNLGDRYGNSGGHNNAGLSGGPSQLEGRSQRATDFKATRRQAPDRYNQDTSFDGAPVRPKSLLGLPWRYAIGCIDGLAAPDNQQWVLRAEVIWSKRNSLPESVTDRVRRSHEHWFHLTKEERYFSATDEIREPVVEVRIPGGKHRHEGRTYANLSTAMPHPLGRLPGSVWEVASEPLMVPEHLGVAHYAAFPQELVRRIVLGWSPKEICTACGEGRRPISDRDTVFNKARDQDHASDIARRAVDRATGSGGTAKSTLNGITSRSITGYVCACTPYVEVSAGPSGREPNDPDKQQGTTWKNPGGGLSNNPRNGRKRVYELEGWAAPPTRQAVVLDVFGGTGTTALVSRALGRYGISMDLSADYLKLAKWRIWESGAANKTIRKTNEERQTSLFDTMFQALNPGIKDIAVSPDYL